MKIYKWTVFLTNNNQDNYSCIFILKSDELVIFINENDGIKLKNPHKMMFTYQYKNR